MEEVQQSDEAGNSETESFAESLSAEQDPLTCKPDVEDAHLSNVINNYGEDSGELNPSLEVNQTDAPTKTSSPKEMPTVASSSDLTLMQTEVDSLLAPTEVDSVYMPTDTEAEAETVDNVTQQETEQCEEADTDKDVEEEEPEQVQIIIYLLALVPCYIQKILYHVACICGRPQPMTVYLSMSLSTVNGYHFNG